MTTSDSVDLTHDTAFVNKGLMVAALEYLEANPQMYRPISYGWDLPGWALRLANGRFVPYGRGDEISCPCPCGCGADVPPRIQMAENADGTGRRVELPPAILRAFTQMALCVNDAQHLLLEGENLALPELRAIVERLCA